jgi:hypothetical protein
MKYRLFSDSDGTKFPEDIKRIIAEAKDKFDNLIRKYGNIAEDIISVLKRIEELTKQGSVADEIFDKIKVEFPDFFAVKGFEFIQDALPGIIEKIEEYIGAMNFDLSNTYQASFESYRHKTASIIFEGALGAVHGKTITRVESDSVIQEVYRVKSLLA